MRTLRIKKKSGGFRIVVAPDEKLLEKLRAALPNLNRAQIAICDTDIVHGCIPGSGPVTAARRHIGFEYSLCADLSDFFDHVKKEDIEIRYSRFAFLLPDKDAYYDDLPTEGAVAAQGFPTSPALANIRAADLDKKLKALCEPTGIVYTRYVDDLTFSSNDLPTLLILRAYLGNVVERQRLKLNDRKTRVLWAGPNRSWRRIIYGVAVGETDIAPSRRSRRKLRAVRYKGRRRGRSRQVANGMQEWSRLRTPRPVDHTEIREAVTLEVGLNVLSK